jgi:predicted nucleic acid-binding protein
VNCTVDASAFVAAARATEDHHRDSVEFLAQIRDAAVNVFCPTLVLPECAAAIVRPTDQPILAARTVALIQDFPHLALVSLDVPLARRAAKIAETHRLRGADAVYATVAEMFGATLVSWDGEMCRRAQLVATTMSPSQWLEQMANQGSDFGA